jgi:hypothetical protein
MANQENVVIRINTSANTRGINQIQRGLVGINATSAATQARLNAVGASTNNVTAAINKNSAALGRQNNMMRRTQSLFGSFSRLLKKGFMLLMKGVLIETAAYAAALSSVNLLLKSGAAIVKAYNATLTGLGVAAANAAAGVATMVAIFTQAMRQFAAAQSSASYGGSFAGASQALRLMQADSQLAVFGLQSLNSAFAAASKNAKITGASIAGIRGLSDFAIASGDMEKGLTAAANLVTLLQSGKKAGSSEVLKAATELGPEFEKAFKKATSSGKKSNKELLEMFASGELAEAAGVAGTAANVRGTLMGQLKTFASEFQVLFADIGQAFIGPTQRSFEQISNILRRTIVQISGQLNLFAQGPFQNVIVGGIDKLGTFTAKLVNEYLPRTEEVLGKIGAWWTSTSSTTKNFFTRMELFLKRFSEASTEINKFFGGILRRIGDELNKSFENFGGLVVENKDEFQEFGRTLQDLVSSIFNLFREVRESFFKALPAIQTITNAVRDLVDAFAGLLDALQNLGSFGGLLGLIGFGGMAAGGRRRARGKGPGGVSRAMRSPTALTLGAAALPQFVPGLGMGGDLLTAGLLGGFAGRKLSGAARNQLSNPLKSATLGRARWKALHPFAKASPAKMMGAGAVAAVGGVGTNMAIDFMEDRFANTGANIGTGAAGGALTGAAAGAILGGPVGAAIGAALGGLIGAVGGWWKSKKAKDKAKKAGVEFAGGYADEVTKLLQTGNIREAEKAIADFGSTLEEVSKKVGRSSEFRSASEERFQKRLDALNPAIDMFNRNLNDLMRVTGKTEQEIIAVSQAAGIDLSSNLLNLQEILSETGLVVGRFGRDFNTAISMALGDAVASIQQRLRILEAPKVLNEQAQAFRELSLAGAVTDEDRASLLTTVFEQATLMYGNDPLAAVEFIRKNIGTAGTPGIQFTTPGGVLSGLQGDFFGGGGSQMLQAGFRPIEDQLRTLITDNIVASVAAQDGVVSREMIQRSVAGMGFDKLMELANMSRSSGFLASSTPVLGAGQEYQRAQMQSRISELLDTNIKVTQSESSKIADAIEGVGLILDPMKDAIDLFNTNIQLLIDAVSTNDTYSPRRNLVSTMSKHNSFDGMIAGKRSVTSSLRNVGLGSPSSDHAFGLAYDLTGQNLGMYQSVVQAGGGYAEFHGAGGGRHLHVVPGDAPMGDRATPVLAGRMSSAPSYSSADSYTINVYPSDGADPREIAEEVMNRIKREQRSTRERN